MTPQEVEQIVRLFQAADIGGAIASDREARAAQFLRDLNEVQESYARRFPSRPMHPPLLAQLEQDASSLKPLIQAFAAMISPEMRTMIYCVLRGASIERVSFEYEAQRKAHLAVHIELPWGEQASFQSEDIWDFEVLRHLGTAKTGGKPLIDGYYAFRKG